MNLFAHDARANDEMYRATDEMLRLASKMGSLEYTHGIGIRLANLMKEKRSETVRIMKKIKGLLDPNNIMNPGKMSL